MRFYLAEDDGHVVCIESAERPGWFQLNQGDWRDSYEEAVSHKMSCLRSSVEITQREVTRAKDRIKRFGDGLWKSWKFEVVRIVKTEFPNCMIVIDHECWRIAFDRGDSPQEALKNYWS